MKDDFDFCAISGCEAARDGCWDKCPHNIMNDDLASVEDLMLSGICEECDQDPTNCYLKDFCAYGHTRAEVL